MSSSSNLFDTLYTQFVLRDVLGRAIPGFLFLFSLLQMFDQNLVSALVDLLGDGSLLLIFLYGISFSSGISLQFLGERVGLIQIQTENGDSLERLKANLFKKDWGIRQQRERFVVLKTMTGNFAVVFYFLIIFTAIKSIQTPWSELPIASHVLSLFLFLLFLSQNEYYFNQQKQWEDM